MKIQIIVKWVVSALNQYRIAPIIIVHCFTLIRVINLNSTASIPKTVAMTEPFWLSLVMHAHPENAYKSVRNFVRRVIVIWTQNSSDLALYMFLIRKHNFG